MTAPRLIIFAAVCGGAWGLFASLRRWPAINDITTTPEDPPRFKALAGGAPYPAAFAPVQRKAYPDLAPVPVPGDAMSAALAAAQALGWTVVARERDRFEAVATTRLLRFKDDVVVELRNGGAGAELHVRSRSRLGRGDLGANARRLRSFREALSLPASKG